MEIDEIGETSKSNDEEVTKKQYEQEKTIKFYPVR